MNPLLLILPAFGLYWLGYKWYSRILERAWGVDPSRKTPAQAHNDGVDYVPTQIHVLFAHHFSAIAAASPVLGPTWALLYGVAPAWAWIVLGGVFLGAAHDFACLFASIREDGRSIAEIAKKTLGPSAFMLYVIFLVFNLVIINATFINITAVSLTSLRAPQDLGLGVDQTAFKTVEHHGQTMAVVGGIASTSAIALTLIAPFLGWLLVKRKLRMPYAYPLATLLCVSSVVVGFAYPVALPMNIWIILIAVYIWLAAAAPVWTILQPREFVSVQFLYLGIALILLALLGAGAQGIHLQAPLWNVGEGQKSLGWIWPNLFITIACGAISGFHGMVASGTTSKQLANEAHARPIGYLVMLGESLLAAMVLLAVATGVSYGDFQSVLVRPAGAGLDWKANPVLAFSMGVAGICEMGLGIPKWLGIVFGLLMVEGFVLDTLDVSIRLNRYLLEEIWASWLKRVPAILKNPWVNSGIAIGLMFLLAYGNTADKLWPIFGAGNQLLAALSLFAVSVWLWKKGRRVAYTLLPAILVGLTALTALILLLFNNYLPKQNYVLAVTDVLLLGLSISLAILIWRTFRNRDK